MTKQKWWTKVFPIALFGVAFGAVSAIALYGWSIYKIVTVFLPQN